jgi:hypothetical protein
MPGRGETWVGGDHNQHVGFHHGAFRGSSTRSRTTQEIMSRRAREILDTRRHISDSSSQSFIRGTSLSGLTDLVTRLGGDAAALLRRFRRVSLNSDAEFWVGGLCGLRRRSCSSRNLAGVMVNPRHRDEVRSGGAHASDRQVLNCAEGHRVGSCCGEGCHQEVDHRVFEFAQPVDAIGRDIAVDELVTPADQRDVIVEWPRRALGFGGGTHRQG